MEFPQVKQERLEEFSPPQRTPLLKHRTAACVIPDDVIDLIDSDDENDGGTPAKKQRLGDGDGGVSVSLPPGFLDPLPDLPDSALLLPPPPSSSPSLQVSSLLGGKSFWKAGDYEGSPGGGGWDNNTGGMDHVRVHPKFLHSNATSHKWALGAFAELLDNSLDEVCNGATYVNVDMLVNKKDRTRMILVEDNGGGMDPDKMRQCMSLGYSAKSKLANTIGQYGNGFKTSTMRLGADVIVFSRCRGTDGKSVTQSIGLLSYTFLRSTRKEDIVVPILDYENKEKEWHKLGRFSTDDWNRNVDTIVNWSPYSSEAELLQQFNLMKDHGTRIIIYNLWEDDQGQSELEFDCDRHDIQLRGVNRDEKSIQMAKEYPNSRHFLTYRHSLRSYVSILYLRLPPNFRIILRGKDVEHHNVVNDMMMAEEVTYRPQPTADGVQRDFNMVAVVTIGFVKDAKAHIDVQGFNVYHKNRLIKPFWRVWNAAGSDGRGVIGVLEANFVEPAHDKQGFERTTVLARLENKLVQMQKTYWSTHCHKIGYAPRRNKKQLEYDERESSPDYTPSSSRAKKKVESSGNDKSYSPAWAAFNKKGRTAPKSASMNEKYGNGNVRYARAKESSDEPSSSSEDTSYGYNQNREFRKVNGTSNGKSQAPGKGGTAATLKSAANGGPVTASTQTSNAFGSGAASPFQKASEQAQRTIGPAEKTREPAQRTSEPAQKTSESAQKDTNVNNGVVPDTVSDGGAMDQLKEENRQLKERLEKKDELLSNLQRELQLEKDKCKSLETKLQEAQNRIDELNKEQESLIDIFSEERDRRDIEEENLRKRMRVASNSIEELREKVRFLESKKSSNNKR